MLPPTVFERNLLRTLSLFPKETEEEHAEVGVGKELLYGIHSLFHDDYLAFFRKLPFGFP